MFILGLNVYHADSSACLTKDGKVLFAAEEERFVREKHYAGFPLNAIKFCLNSANIDLSSIELISLNKKPDSRIFKKIKYLITTRPNFTFINNRILNNKKIYNIEEDFEKHFNISKEILKKKIFYVDHHISHLLSSLTGNGFEESSLLSVDGFGDFVSTQLAHYKNNKVKIISEINFPHSLGLFYTAITQFLGFPNYGDEYKVMGLSSYGEPKYTNELRQILKLENNGFFKLNLNYFLHHKQGFEYNFQGKPIFGNVFSEELENLLGPKRSRIEEIKKKHFDIASSAQKIYEEALFNLCDNLFKITSNPNLSLSGGCAMNSVANGKLIMNTKFKNIYIPSSPGDSGGAIGSAYAAYLSINKKPIKYFENPYLGPSFSDEEVKKVIDKRINKENYLDIYVQKIKEKNALFFKIATLLNEKKVIGLFQGRMEWGSRALGNRSIIADPRLENIKDILNSKIKRREAFRPFAPSILREEVSNWFEVVDDVPFMSKVYNIKQDKKNLVPGVVHVDGSCRLQTVTDQLNYNYYQIIKNFFKITGVPLILNTSFNENEPIVCTPTEALDCFLRTKMDCLVMNNYLVMRHSS